MHQIRRQVIQPGVAGESSIEILSRVFCHGVVKVAVRISHRHDRRTQEFPQVVSAPFQFGDYLFARGRTQVAVRTRMRSDLHTLRRPVPNLLSSHQGLYRNTERPVPDVSAANLVGDDEHGSCAAILLQQRKSVVSSVGKCIVERQ